MIHYYSIKLFFRSNKHLDFAKDVSISYIDSLEPTEERRKLLRDQYFFECFCPKCEKSVTFEEVEKDVESLQTLLQCTEL